MEDVHSQVESCSRSRIGEAGKKIHSGRSRNDQVMVDLRIFLRRSLYGTALKIARTFSIRLQELSENTNTLLMPGYTHLQVAMPSSFGSGSAPMPSRWPTIWRRSPARSGSVTATRSFGCRVWLLFSARP